MGSGPSQTPYHLSLTDNTHNGIDKQSKWQIQLKIATSVIKKKPYEWSLERRSELLPVSQTNRCSFPRRREPAGRRRSTSLWSCATWLQWSCSSAAAPTWTPPCSTAARRCTWLLAGRTPPSPTSSASLVLTWCCGTWRTRLRWTSLTATKM